MKNGGALHIRNSHLPARAREQLPSRTGPCFLRRGMSTRLQVFVSSKMQELAPEREAIKSALSDLHVDAFVFEADAGARPGTIRQTYLQELDDSDLYIGLFWKSYGEYTID